MGWLGGPLACPQSAPTAPARHWSEPSGGPAGGRSLWSVRRGEVMSTAENRTRSWRARPLGDSSRFFDKKLRESPSGTQVSGGCRCHAAVLPDAAFADVQPGGPQASLTLTPIPRHLPWGPSLPWFHPGWWEQVSFLREPVAGLGGLLPSHPAAHQASSREL